MDSRYRTELERQFSNLSVPGIRYFYQHVYSFVLPFFERDASILEIGAGAGTSSIFANDFNITRTDILPFEKAGVIGGVDAHNLPFENGLFDGAFAFDAIHHMRDPYQVFSEMMRVIKLNANLVFVEPYVSPLSYIPYKLFHPEEVSMKLNPNHLRFVVDNSAESGNQSILQHFMKSNYFCEMLGKGRIKLNLVKRFSPFSFFVTGGINRPSSVSTKTLDRILLIENKFPKVLNTVLGSRQIVSIQKCSSQIENGR